MAPTPMAMAPRAPWVLVWLSAPTTTMPGPHVPVLGEDLVADASFVGADVVELGDALRGHELPDLLLIGGRLRGLRRDPMVEDDGDLGRVPHSGLEPRALEDLVELVDDKSRVLVRHGQVDRRLYHLTRRDAGQAGRPGQDLLRNGHAH